MPVYRVTMTSNAAAFRGAGARMFCGVRLRTAVRKVSSRVLVVETDSPDSLEAGMERHGEVLSYEREGQ